IPIKISVNSFIALYHAIGFVWLTIVVSSLSLKLLITLCINSSSVLGGVFANGKNKKCIPCSYLLLNVFSALENSPTIFLFIKESFIGFNDIPTMSFP